MGAGDNANRPSVRDLFLNALDKPSWAERQAYLDGACGADAALRAKVDQLLKKHQTDSFLDKAAADVLNTEIGPERAPSEKPGDRIGHYKLLQQIGEGGCGVVYLADQESPVRRRVALKVIKLGMDTKSVIARFEAERQALAMMDHPNIAKVLDAGATETGRPYFVMELVRGVRITEYCDQNRLSTESRLKLFVQVCHAVQHAHQKGVIHRDIKPSNILVMVADDVPVPKMIDFGIAKAIGERLTDKTLYTRFDQFIGTPAYMSPEQAGLSGLDIDTRSDIYSLGVLLYELLTGCTPFEPNELAQAGLDEIIRRIREEDPPKPSTRLSRLEQREKTTTAQRRATEAPRLIRSLRGDLDWIVVKCLEKNRTRRYETANELVHDIECHLNHQPVSAAAPTLGYRTMKYARRHRRVLATAAGFALLLGLGTTLYLWQARRAAQAVQERVQAEKARLDLRQEKEALETLPEIERLLAKDEYTTAFRLVEQARPFLADNPKFQELAPRTVSVIAFETTPPGADVFIRNYSDTTPKWEPVGKSPLKEIRMPRGVKRWKVRLSEYETVEGALFTGSRPVEIKVQLDRVGTLAPGMVRIRGEKCRADLCLLDAQALPELELPDFLLDRYEVSNRSFKEFVEAGGYQKPEFWKHQFVQGSVELSWSAAMKLFVDQTGKPGPATWRNGEFPKGHEEYPVAGVSWYEAAAYAEWAGKCLPTAYHWSLAAGDMLFVDVGYIVPLSNFESKGPAPVGTCQGMSFRGIYDMAGNVKEWCFNQTPEGNRLMAGGAWNETSCMIGGDKRPPLDREVNCGFRCMKLLSDDSVWKRAGVSVRCKPPYVLSDQEPCSEDAFRGYRKWYDYSKGDLQPAIESREDLSSYTHREKVSFNAAYPNQRVIAYLFLPRSGKPPFQTLVYFPAGIAFLIPSVDQYPKYSELKDVSPKRGRAFIIPVLQGMFERKLPPDKQGTASEFENAIMWAKDYRRTLDYLETRPEVFDTNKLAFVGASSGAWWGGILPAVEPRIKVAVMEGGGYWPDYPPEFNQINFAPRIKIPILLEGALYDTALPVELNQKPFLRLFATPEQDKHYKVYDTGHGIWDRNEWVLDEHAFLDRYFGPAK